MGTLTDLTNRVIENCAFGKIGLQDVVANDVLDNPVTIAQGLNSQECHRNAQQIRSLVYGAQKGDDEQARQNVAVKRMTVARPAVSPIFFLNAP